MIHILCIVLWEDTDHFGESSHQSSLLKLGSDGSIAQAITQNTREKVLFLIGDCCVCIGYCVVVTIANIQLRVESITGIDKYSTPTPHSACMTVGQL